MNSKTENDYIEPEFSDLFNLESVEQQMQHEARMIMYRFLSEIERIEGSERGLKKKLATAIKKSQSFVTQLFNGDKIINLLTIAKFQKALGIKFKITAYSEKDFDLICTYHEPVQNFFNLLPKEEYSRHFASVSADNTAKLIVQTIEKNSPQYS